MTIREITKFVTDDGTEHASREKAERYLAINSIVACMREDDVQLDEMSYQDLAGWLLDYFDLTPKPRQPDDNP